MCPKLTPKFYSRVTDRLKFRDLKMFLHEVSTRAGDRRRHSKHIKSVAQVVSAGMVKILICVAWPVATGLVNILTASLNTTGVAPKF